MTLPPGQRAVDRFPRFGTHLHRPAPAVPADPAIEVSGAVKEPFSVPLADLTKLPRREQTADFHCVAGWTATDLRWEGVPFEAFYRRVVEPSLAPGAAVTHFGFVGLDHYRSVVTIEDALSEDVLIAEHLDGQPLDSDHGAPLRLVSPSQYGYMNTKHLCRVEVHTAEPEERYERLPLITRVALRSVFVKPHPRARVAEEERARHLPGWAVRLPYRSAIAPIRWISERGSASRHAS